MPTISMFYGIIIQMYYYDDQQHNLPHIHVRYGEQKCIVQIPDCDILAGELDRKKLKLVQAWIEIHQEELMADWQLAVNGQNVFKIEPLR